MSTDERMSYRQYAKYEKIFFLYGSVSKMVAPVRPDEWKTLAEDMWAWALIKVDAFFAGHRYAVGKEYAIEYEAIPRGEYVDLRIKEPK